MNKTIVFAGQGAKVRLVTPNSTGQTNTVKVTVLGTGREPKAKTITLHNAA